MFGRFVITSLCLNTWSVVNLMKFITLASLIFRFKKSPDQFKMTCLIKYVFKYNYFLTRWRKLKESFTAQKMKFSIKYFFSKCEQIRRKLRIWSHLLKNPQWKTLIFVQYLLLCLYIGLMSWVSKLSKLL